MVQQAGMAGGGMAGDETEALGGAASQAAADYEALRNDIAKLTQTVSQLVQHQADAAKSQVHQAYDSAKAKATQAAADAQDKAMSIEADIEEAREELEGKDEMNPEPTAEENVTEDKRWDPVPASEGTQAPTVPASDEQTVAEKLYDEGVADAEHDQEIQATRDAWRRDREG